MFKSFQYKWVFAVIPVLALIALFSFFVAPGLADDVTGTAEVIAGALTIDATGQSIDFPNTTLNGTDQTQTDTIDIDVQDFTGSGDGWKLQITSTSFTDGSNTLPNSSLSITGVNAACDTGSCTNPTNGIGYPFTVPADATAPAAASFFNAAANTGMGDFTVTPTFQLSIPATTYAGTYQSTVTLTILSGP